MSEKQRKPGFDYIYSKTLNQELARSQKTGIVYCEDGTKYTPHEINIANKAMLPIPIEVHLIKKMFGGELFYAEQKRKWNFEKNED